MSFWKYLIKTSLEQKKTDWAEFQDLRQQAEDAHNAMLAARGRISSVHDVTKYARPYSCVNYIIDENKNMKEQMCPVWYDCRGGVDFLKSKCDYAEQNREYHDAYDKADALRQTVDKFWGKKFERVK